MTLDDFTGAIERVIAGLGKIACSIHASAKSSLITLCRAQNRRAGIRARREPSRTQPHAARKRSAVVAGEGNAYRNGASAVHACFGLTIRDYSLRPCFLPPPFCLGAVFFLPVVDALGVPARGLPGLLRWAIRATLLVSSYSSSINNKTTVSCDAKSPFPKGRA